jgi:hypothetical protein
MISLVVLAAGYGQQVWRVMQMDSFGRMEKRSLTTVYMMRMRAGFEHVVFIIRDFFADKFIEVFDPKMNGRMKTDYVYQELSNLPHPFFFSC